MRGIDEAGLTPEQWDAVFGFITHNFADVVNDAGLVLTCCRAGLLDVDEIARVESELKRDYREIVETLRSLKDEAASRRRRFLGTTDYITPMA